MQTTGTSVKNILKLSANLTELGQEIIWGVWPRKQLLGHGLSDKNRSHASSQHCRESGIKSKDGEMTARSFKRILVQSWVHWTCTTDNLNRRAKYTVQLEKHTSLLAHLEARFQPSLNCYLAQRQTCRATTFQPNTYISNWCTGVSDWSTNSDTDHGSTEHTGNDRFVMSERRFATFSALCHKVKPCFQQSYNTLLTRVRCSCGCFKCRQLESMRMPSGYTRNVVGPTSPIQSVTISKLYTNQWLAKSNLKSHTDHWKLTAIMWKYEQVQMNW